jgi:hypothetical protein
MNFCAAVPTVALHFRRVISSPSEAGEYLRGCDMMSAATCSGHCAILKKVGHAFFVNRSSAQPGSGVTAKGDEPAI